MVRQKFYGEGGILVAEGGSLIVASEVPPSVPSSRISGSGGTGPPSMRLGWHFFRRLGSTTGATFLPRRRYQEWKVAPADGVAALRVLVDEEGECQAWWPGDA